MWSRTGVAAGAPAPKQGEIAKAVEIPKIAPKVAPRRAVGAIAAAASSLAVARLAEVEILNPDTRAVVRSRTTPFGSAAIGFADDYIKIVKRRSLGLSARWKLSFQIGLAVILWWVAFQEVGLDPSLQLRIFDADVYLGPVVYVVLSFIVINLVTDLIYAYLDPRIRYE